MRKKFFCNPLITASLISLAFTPFVYANASEPTEEISESTSPVVTVTEKSSENPSAIASSSNASEPAEEVPESTSPVVTITEKSSENSSAIASNSNASAVDDKSFTISSVITQGSGMSQDSSLNENLSLSEIDSRRLSALEKSTSLKEEILNLSSFIQQTQICSEANRAFNQLYEKHKEYLLENYSAALYSSLYKLKYRELGKGTPPSFLSKDISALDADKESLTALLPEAKAKANALFDSEYELMCKIVNAEVGDSSDIEHYWECNMLENRKRHPAYPNTLHAVVFQRGQFSPTWNGQINKPINPRVRKNVEEYMRGLVETGMPQNVVYQARFRQGSGVWQHLPGGEYFCYR